MTKSSQRSPLFSLCCHEGSVRLPPVTVPSAELQPLFSGNDSVSRRFLDNIWTFNNAVAFVSTGCNVDARFPGSRGAPTFRIHGELYHRLGSILPPDGVTLFNTSERIFLKPHFFSPLERLVIENRFRQVIHVYL